MITILAVFCQLAFLHVNCTPKSHPDPEIEQWRLSEVFIKWESPLQPTERYTRDVKLFRYDNGFRLDTLIDGSDEDKKVIACFYVEELHAFLDNELYAFIQHPNQVIRMTLAHKNEASKFKKFFTPTPLDCAFKELKKYYILELVVSDGVADRVYKDEVAYRTQTIILTVYGGLDSGGNETEARRFIISGGNRDLLFAVFNRDEFISVRKGSDNRLVLEVRPPGNFWGKLYYGMKLLYYRDDRAETFIKEMSEHTSRSATPDASPLLLSSLAESP